jgi:hypothetical protein
MVCDMEWAPTHETGLGQTEGGAMNKTAIGIVIAVLVVILIIFAIWRSPANAQDVEDESVALLATALQNLQAQGAYVEYNLIGTVEDKDATVESLSRDSELILLFSDGALRPFSLAELSKQGYIDENYTKPLQDSLQQNISPGDSIYRLSIGGQVTHMTISSDATRTAGTLPMASRLPFVGYTQASYVEADRRRECTKRILTYDIFGREAESITACTQAFCLSGTPELCELSEISSKTGWFGAMAYEPSTPPVAGDILHQYCRGNINYKWEVVIGPLKIGDYVDFDVVNARLGGQGNLISEVDCGR